MSIEELTPNITQDFLDWLEKRFSPKVPDSMLDDPREYDFLAGQQHVVTALKAIAHRQDLADY